MRFAAINRIGKDFIDGHLWLKHGSKSSKFYKIEHFNRDDYVHKFRIHDESDIDDEFRSLMRAARDIGERKHLPRSSR